MQCNGRSCICRYVRRGSSALELDATHPQGWTKKKGCRSIPFSTPVPLSLAASHGCPVRCLEQAAPIPRQQAEAPRRMPALPACARLHRRQALARQPVRPTVAPLRAAVGQAQALSPARAERLLPAQRRAAPAACPRPARWRRSQGSPAVAPLRPWLRLQLPPWPGARLRVDGDEPRADRSVRGRSASASGWQPVPLRASRQSAPGRAGALLPAGRPALPLAAQPRPAVPEYRSAPRLVQVLRWLCARRCLRSQQAGRLARVRRS